MAKTRAESRQGMVVTTIALPAALHKKLMLAAVEDNAAATEIVRRAVAEHLARRGKKGNR